MNEGLKIIGAGAWVAGLIGVFIEPLIGTLILLVALLLSIRSASITRERRHQELLEATRREREK